MKKVLIIVCSLLLVTACKDVNQPAPTAETPEVTETAAITGAAPPMTKAPASYTADSETETSGVVTLAEIVTLAETTAITDAAPPMTKVSESYTADSETEAAALAEPVTASDTIDNGWALFLVNFENPLPENFAPDLVSVGSYNGTDRKFDRRAADYLKSMVEAAKKDGVTLTYLSTYRTAELQAANFKNAYNERINSGYSKEDAFAETMREIAVPKTSEHNAGVAVDFNSLSETFDQTAEYRWLSQNAHKFGFIMRYPKNKTGVTGVMYEPWHWRFVGIYHAGKIRESGLILEEYIGVSARDDSTVAAFKREILSGA